MSNIKSWADASSDEESEDDRIAPPPSNLPGSSAYFQQNESDDDDDDDDDDYGPPPPKQYEIPTSPPYTAFIGNLHFDIRNNHDLFDEIEILLNKRRLEVISDGGVVKGVVRVSSARLMTERETGKSRGYGYCEFDSGEELLAFLQMDNPQLCGRTIKVDVASSTPKTSGDGRRRSETGPRGSRGGRDRGGGDRDSRRGNRSDIRGSQDVRGSIDGGRSSGRMNYDRNDSRGGSMSSMGGGRDSGPKIDGSQFRGGIHGGPGYSRGSSGNLGPSTGTNPTSVMRRGDSSVSSHGSNTNLGGSMSGSVGGGAMETAPKQRPRLSLLARTKPVEEASASVSQSSIFGGAKPRDEAKILAEKKEVERKEAERKLAEKKEEEKKQTEEEDAATKEVTTGMEKVKIMNKPSVGVDELNNVALDWGNEDTKSSAAAAAPTDKKDGKDDADTAQTSTTSPNETSAETKTGPKKINMERKDSRGSGRGGRGGRNRENSDRKGRDGRRDSTRKSGRGSGRGEGGRGRSGGRGGEGGRGDRRNSKANKKNGSTDNGKKTDAGSSLASSAEAGEKQVETPVVMPVQEVKKQPPKKINSFAAFMDDSDSD